MLTGILTEVKLRSVEASLNEFREIQKDPGQRKAAHEHAINRIRELDESSTKTVSDKPNGKKPYVGL